MKFTIFQESRIGKRKGNQDRTAYCYSRDALFMVVADGMGGYLHGEVAAEPMLLVVCAGHGVFQPGQSGLVGAHAPEVHQGEARVAHAREARAHGPELATGARDQRDKERRDEKCVPHRAESMVQVTCRAQSRYSVHWTITRPIPMIAAKRLPLEQVA